MKLKLLILFLFISSLCNAQVPGWLWVKLSPNVCGGNAMATDKQGNIYLSVIYYDTLTIKPLPTFVSNGYSNICTAKFDRNGNLLWASSTHGNYNEDVSGISVDGEGNAYIVGSTQSDTMSFGTIKVPRQGGQQDLFIAKYNTAGNVVWAKSFADPNYSNVFQAATSIATDANGNSYVTGWFYGTLTIPPLTGVTSCGGAGDMFIFKMDTNGNGVWAKAPACTENAYYTGTQAESIALDHAGNLLVTVLINGSETVVGADTVKVLQRVGGIDGADAFVLCYTTAGSFKWLTKFNGNNENNTFIACSDSSNNWYVAGFHAQWLTFPGITLTTAGQSGTYYNYLVKLDSAGNALWGCDIGNTSYGQEIRSIACDSHSNVYLGGNFQGPFCLEALNIDTVNLTQYAPDLYAYYIAKFTPQGHVTLVQSSQGYLTQAAVDVDNNLLASGNFTYYATFDSTFDYHFTTGNETQFLAKYGLQTTTGINRTTPADDNVLLYPNPFTQSATLTFQNTVLNSSSATLTVYDMCGRKVRSTAVSASPITIEREGLADGMYFYQLQSKDNTVAGKFIIGR